MSTSKGDSPIFVERKSGQSQHIRKEQSPTNLRGKPMRTRLSACALLLLACTPLPATAAAAQGDARGSADFIWLEGEKPAAIPQGMAVIGRAAALHLGTAHAEPPCRRQRGGEEGAGRGPDGLVSVHCRQGRQPAGMGPHRLRVRPGTVRVAAGCRRRGRRSPRTI